MKATYDYCCGIDTIELISPTYLDYSPPFFSHDNKRRIVGNSPETYAYRFNPSYTYYTNNYSLSNCIKAIYYATEEVELQEPIINRIDFCFDDRENDYRDLYKLNHLLFYLLAKKLNISNDYSSCGIVSPVQKTLRIQNGKLEAEFYNKLLEEPKGKIKCRLELRIKRVKFGINDITALCEALAQWLDSQSAIDLLTPY